MKILFLDWSGDAGFRFRHGSSRYLSIACVASSAPFDNALDAIRAARELGKRFYYHFSDASEVIKPVFFQALAETEIRGAVLRIDKSRLSTDFHRMRGIQLVAHFIAETISGLPETMLEDRSLIFDGSRDETTVVRAIRIALSARMRQMGKPLFDRVTARPAQEEAGLQGTDMLAGAASSARLADNALLGYLRGKVIVADYEEKNRLG